MSELLINIIKTVQADKNHRFSSLRFGIKSAIEQLILITVFIMLISLGFPNVGQVIILHLKWIMVFLCGLTVKNIYVGYRWGIQYYNFDAQESRAEKASQLNEFYREVILQAEYNIDIANKNMNNFKMFSLCSILSMLLWQWQGGISAENLKKLYISFLPITSKIVDGKFITLEKEEIFICVIVFFVLFGIYKYYKSYKHYRHWRYKKLNCEMRVNGYNPFSTKAEDVKSKKTS